MKVTILRNTMADGGKDFGPGDTPDLPTSEALILLSTGAAKRFSESPETAESPAPKAAEKASKK